MLQLLGRTQVIYYSNYTQSGKSVHCLFEKQIAMGRRAFRKSEKSVQTYMQISMGRCVPEIYFIQCAVFFMARKFRIILCTLHLCGHCL